MQAAVPCHRVDSGVRGQAGVREEGPGPIFAADPEALS